MVSAIFFEKVGQLSIYSTVLPKRAFEAIVDFGS
jgi:hypothetical protein